MGGISCRNHIRSNLIFIFKILLTINVILLLLVVAIENDSKAGRNNIEYSNYAPKYISNDYIMIKNKSSKKITVKVNYDVILKYNPEGQEGEALYDLSPYEEKVIEVYSLCGAKKNDVEDLKLDITEYSFLSLYYEDICHIFAWITGFDILFYLSFIKKGKV